MPIEQTVLDAMLIKEYRVRSITAYNRLEVSPRTREFDRSLKAEVRDALWMLTRQWQFGEFQGEDAASIVTSKILGDHVPMNHVVFPVDHRFSYNKNIPLETQVESEKLSGTLFLATQMCRYFLRLMTDEDLLGYVAQLQLQYKLDYKIDPNDYEGNQLFNAVKDELFDGFKLYQDSITTGTSGSLFEDWLVSEAIPPGDQTIFKKIVPKFQKWFARNYSQQDSPVPAWLPSQLEYQFTLQSQIAEGQQKILSADQYYEGHLDWYSFDIIKNRIGRIPEEPEESPSEKLKSFIPSPARFKGMPHPRFWTMEENVTDFGKIDTSTTGLLHLLLAEFGLIYSNDWFMLPYPLDINTLCEIKGITVTDVFGQHTLIRPAGRGPSTNWHRWTMFEHTDSNSPDNLTNLLYLPPSVSNILQGEPLEKVNFLRDEMANMVWAVENRVPSQAGKGMSGNEMAEKDAPPPPFVPLNDKVPVRYVAGTTVSENWIPFIPVRIEGSDREIKLQRASMPDAKGPMGVLLSEKLAPYFVNEEEIPRSGISVERCFQRTRWLNGKTFLWIGRYKGAGKGEGWSNLQFDQIWDIPNRNIEEENP